MLTGDQEIIFNCWYVYDELALMYSLRARAYVGSGSEEEKMRLLRERSQTDYLIAKSFSLPERYRTAFPIVDGTQTETAVIPVKLLALEGGPLPVADLFEEALQQLWSEMPKPNSLVLPAKPLICLTPLLLDKSFQVTPIFRGTRPLAE